ncbi:MAG: hypothetical protein ABI880_08800 [Acidobacteriota bacterium]
MASTKVALTRRIGQFSVGTFAGACALFAPRLTLMVGHPDDGSLRIVALSPTFVAGAVLLSLIVGGVAMILEWDGTRSPKDTFMAALGVPALLSGVFSTASVSNEAVRFAGIAKQQADGRAKDEGIVVDDRPQSSLTPAQGVWPPTLHLMPTVFAAEQAPAPVMAADQKGAAIQYRQVRYWVVFYEDRAKDIADRHAAGLGTQYGTLTVRSLGSSFIVTLASGTLPYSDAVTSAVEIKKKSQGVVTPRLVRAD